MNDTSTERMLLSHNFDLKNNELHALNREEFAQVFIAGLQDKSNITCHQIENPHWVVEVIYPTTTYKAVEVGQMCCDVLTCKRESDLGSSKLATDTLFLGGKKFTPAFGSSPTSLQPGEWGVDVVETAQADIFLDSINWNNLTVGKPEDSIFKIELLKS